MFCVQRNIDSTKFENTETRSSYSGALYASNFFKKYNKTEWKESTFHSLYLEVQPIALNSVLEETKRIDSIQEDNN